MDNGSDESIKIRNKYESKYPDCYLPQTCKLYNPIVVVV